MSNLSSQQINQTFDGLLQVPGGITSTLQTVQDGNGNPTGLQLSSSGASVTTSSTFVPSVDGTQITGAVPRLISDGFGDYVSLKDFGAVGDGSDVTTIFNTALDYVISNKKRLHIPAGRYVISSTVTKTITGYGSIHISGDGQNVTIIKLNTGGDGLNFNLIGTAGNYWIDLPPGNVGIHISNLSFTTTNANVGTGLTINGGSFAGRPTPSTSISHVDFRADNASAQYWATACTIVDCCSISFEFCRFFIGGPSNTTSNGLSIYGSSATASPAAAFLTNCTFLYGDVQFNIGDYFEGAYVTQCDMVNGKTGIKKTGSSNEAGLHVMGGHISASVNCINLLSMTDFEIVGALLYSRGITTNYSSIKLEDVARFTISGNVIKGSGAPGPVEAGIEVVSSQNIERMGAYIGGNSFNYFTNSGGTCKGIWLKADANLLFIGENSFRDCDTRVLNQSTNYNNSFTPKIYTDTKVISITGGATTEIFTVTVPDGLFNVTPAAAICQATSGTELFVSTAYRYTNSTTTVLSFIARNPSGGVITGNPNYRFSVIAFEDVYSDVS
jgi:hypothetical protein